eukprot:scaffold1806_cov240-Pinguiococcus_pyrenoidosus.AAC.14
MPCGSHRQRVPSLLRTRGGLSLAAFREFHMPVIFSYPERRLPADGIEARERDCTRWRKRSGTGSVPAGAHPSTSQIGRYPRRILADSGEGLVLRSRER